MKRFSGAILLVLGLVRCAESETEPIRSYAVPNAGNSGRGSSAGDSACAPVEEDCGGGGLAASAGGSEGFSEAGRGGSEGGEDGLGGDGDGALEIVDVEDAPCEFTDATPAVVLEPEELGLAFDRAGVVEDRYFAFDSASLAFLTFGANGDEPSPVQSADVVSLVGNDDGLRALELDADGELVLSFFDSHGEREPDPVAIDESGTGSHALATGSESLLAVWRRDRALMARAVAADGTASEPVNLGSQACGESGCAPAVTFDGQHFAVVWTALLHSGETVLDWALFDDAGALVSTRRLLSTLEPWELRNATSIGDEGLALLLGEGPPTHAPLVLFVDEFGKLETRAVRLLGATDPFGIAATAEELGVVARSSEERAVFRAISKRGSPLGSWVCIDDAGVDTTFSPRAAIFPEPGGYGFVVRRTDGSSAYLATDARGFERN